jgi:hypothetical protein
MTVRLFPSLAPTADALGRPWRELEEGGRPS